MHRPLHRPDRPGAHLRPRAHRGLLPAAPVLAALLVASALAGCAGVRGADDGASRRDADARSAAERGIAEIQRIERERFEAMTRRDVFALARYLTEDLTYCHSNGLCETRAQLIEGIDTGRTVYRAITVDEIRPRRVGNTWVVNGRIGITGEMAGRPAEMRLVYTDVHVKRDGAWRLTAWQSTRVP